MEQPVCPKCPNGFDKDVRPARSQPGKWYCNHCGHFFASTILPPPDAPIVEKKTYDDEDEVPWALEEVAMAKDRVLAGFFAMLTLADRCVFAGHHIDPVKDFRRRTRTNSDDPGVFHAYATKWEKPRSK